MGAFYSRNEFPVRGRTVLITGGSKGLGRSAGRQLAEKGASVIIAARGLEALQSSIAYISEGAASAEQRFHHISADLIDPQESARVIREATAWNDGSPPDVVWCCAGSSHPTLFVDTPPEKIRHMMDSNYFTAAYMARSALEAWLRPKVEAAAGAPSQPPPRHLIFTGSFLSFYTFAGFAPYSPSKAALRSLSDSLSQEMNLYLATQAHAKTPPIRIHTVFPATIFTESYEEENKVKSDVTKMLEEGDPGQTPDVAARKSIEGLERGEELVTTTLLTRLVMTATLGGSARSGFLKGLVDTMLSWVVVLVMVFVRSDMDSKVRKWGATYGPTGMKKVE